MKYYLANGYCGNSFLLWRTGGGYTENLDEAEQFSEEKAFEQFEMRDGEDKPIPVCEAEKGATRHVDSQRMNPAWWKDRDKRYYKWLKQRSK